MSTVQLVADTEIRKNNNMAIQTVMTQNEMMFATDSIIALKLKQQQQHAN